MIRLGPVVRDARNGLRRNLTMTIAVALCSGVSLALFAAGLLLQKQVSITTSYLYGRVELVLYLEDDIPAADREALGAALSSDPAVRNVEYESKAQAFQEFQRLYRDQPGLVEDVGPDLLPASYKVKLVDPERFDEVAPRYADAPGVESIQDWRGRLEGFFRFLKGFQVAAFVLAAVQGFATLVLLYNTIRVSAHSRRRETAIKRLVGASSLHVQLPFVLESAAAGLAGGLLAAGTIHTLRVVLIDQRFSRQDFTPVLTAGDVWQVIALTLLAGVALSSLMAVIALHRHLRSADARSPSRALRKAAGGDRSGRGPASAADTADPDDPGLVGTSGTRTS